jgi:hypothetical protein
MLKTPLVCKAERVTAQWMLEDGCHMQEPWTVNVGGWAIAGDVLPPNYHCLNWDIAEPNDSCIAARTTLSVEREQDTEPDGQQTSSRYEQEFVFADQAQSTSLGDYILSMES